MEIVAIVLLFPRLNSGDYIMWIDTKECDCHEQIKEIYRFGL